MEENEIIQHVLGMIINDDQLYCGGIPDFDKDLTGRFGLTEKQSAEIECRLYSIVKYMKKIKKFKTMK